MLPINPLMDEHRLIERVVAVMERRAARAAETSAIDPGFVDAVVDFIRTYADRCHHGKEEAILFRHLAKKPLSAEHRSVLDDLLQDHTAGRQATTALAAARQRYGGGDKAALGDIVARLKELATFYPAHIVKEERKMFFPSMTYFTDAEKDRMIEEFWEFDRRLIHDKYGGIVEAMEKVSG